MEIMARGEFRNFTPYQERKDFTDSGEAFELDVFGSPNQMLVHEAIGKMAQGDVAGWKEALRPPEYDPRTNELIREGGKLDERRLKKLLNTVKETLDNDPDYDPDDPSKVYANDVQFLLSQKFADKEVLFYSTVGTIVDRKGIDGFFYCDGKFVTIDVTKRPGKGSRSDLIWQEGRDIVDFYERADLKDYQDGSPQYVRTLEKNVADVAALFESQGVASDDKANSRVANL